MLGELFHKQGNAVRLGGNLFDDLFGQRFLARHVAYHGLGLTAGQAIEGERRAVGKV